MSNKLNIFQYHSNVGIQRYKIALQIGVYSAAHRRNRFAKVLGSTTPLYWELKKWMPMHKSHFIAYSTNYPYGHVVVDDSICKQIVYRIWLK